MKHELPVIVADCGQIVLHELIYLNKNAPDLIEECTLTVNGQVVNFKKSAFCDKTYLVNGEKDGKHHISIGPDQDVKITLTITCGDFSACHCLEHRFQLKLSALYLN